MCVLVKWWLNLIHSPFLKSCIHLELFFKIMFCFYFSMNTYIIYINCIFHKFVKKKKKKFNNSASGSLIYFHTIWFSSLLIRAPSAAARCLFNLHVSHTVNQTHCFSSEISACCAAAERRIHGAVLMDLKDSARAPRGREAARAPLSWQLCVIWCLLAEEHGGW